MLSDILLNKQVYRIETFGYLLFYERERETGGERILPIMKRTLCRKKMIQFRVRCYVPKVGCRLLKFHVSNCQIIKPRLTLFFW